MIAELKKRITAFKPGRPEDWSTTMGAIVSRPQYDRILNYIATAKHEGGELVCGGGRPASPELADGLFIEPTVFTKITPEMTIAREEVFGPVLAVLRWHDELEMRRAVNAVEVGLTCSIWTNDIHAALRTATRVEAGFVWVNEVGRHFLGAPFGGVKQSGFGREECLAELLQFTVEKNIHLKLRPPGRSR